MLSKFARHFRQQFVGYLALFVAMGGTAYAAATIGSAEIIDESIESVDIKNGQVKNDDLLGDVITSNKIKNLGVSTADLAGNAVGSSKVADNSLTGADIDESTLLGRPRSCGCTPKPQ